MTNVSTPEAYAERIFQAVLAGMDLFAIYLGDRLGFYRALGQGQAVTPTELAAAVNCNPRYVREWLEQQAVSGLLTVEHSADPESRRYAMPAGAREVLTEQDSLNYISPVVRLLVSMARPLPELLAAYHNGGGVPWSSYGEDAREGQADVNKPIFLQLIGDWFRRVPLLDERLRREPPGRIADIGSGAGWSSIAIAQHYPLVHVDGIDIDEPSVQLARKNLLGSGVEDRVRFDIRDAGDPDLQGKYDLVTVFEALHDLSQPVEVLKKMRTLLAPGGAVAVIDERVAEKFHAPGDEIERMMYGWSILCCLATGKSESPSAETGTVMRPETLRSYSNQAGYSSVDVVELDHPFFRLYLLRP